MIYNGIYFKKLLGQSYMDKHFGRKGMFLMGILLGVAALIVNSLLTPMRETIFGEIYPNLTEQSFFSVSECYVIAASCFFVVYFIKNYYISTFFEITRNRWYLLRKAGYRPQAVAAQRTLATYISVFCIYSIGFLIAAAVSLILKYQTDFSAVLSVYLAGLLITVGLVSLILFLSLFISRASLALVAAILIALLVYLVDHFTGHYAVYADAAAMSDLRNLFVGRASIFTYMLLGSALLLILVSALIAWRKSGFYHLNGTGDPETQNIFYRDYTTRRFTQVDVYKNERRERLSRLVVRVFLGSLLAVAIFLNLFLFFLSLSSDPDKRTENSSVPFLFESETMKGVIEKNDLVFFRIRGGDYEYQVGDVVLLVHDNREYIQQIVEIEGDELTVDILNYTAGMEVNGFRYTVDRQAVIGSYDGRSRWLGAFIMLFQSTFGKIFLMLGPLILLIFFDGIADFTRAVGTALREKKYFG